MPFDGFVTRALVQELSDKLLHTRIHKIYQPHQTDLLFLLRGRGETYNLMVSANPTYPLFYLTGKNYSNPLEPPMFCMLLRKHLEGGIIEEIRQIGLERIVHIDIRVRDELGDIQTKRLIIEIMGRHSNIILVNPDNNTILDGINHVTPAISSYRQVLPGKEYKAPPDQNKKNPLNIKQEEFFTLLKLNEGKVDKQLVDLFEGFSPAIAKEIVYLAGLPTKENLWNAFYQWTERIKKNEFRPSIILNPDRSDFSVLPLDYLKGEVQSYPTINECVENYYAIKAERDTVRQKTNDLSKILQIEKNKNEQKIKYLYNDLEEAKKAKVYKLYGELVTAHLHQLKKGDKEASLINYYDENQSKITIPLDPLKSPSENAQSFFKKYNKLRNSMNYIDEQLKKTREEIDYLEMILTQLENAGVKDIEEIREELTEQGYIKERKRNQRKKNKVPEIEQFLSSEGIPIYVGKNNKQNEYLTHRFASASDTWLHTKNIPGSHVVIKTKEFGEQTLHEAAVLAAYYSKAKLSSQVPVDYTLVKHVKKPSGAKPGFVIYENQKTLYVTPDEGKVKDLQKKK